MKLRPILFLLLTMAVGPGFAGGSLPTAQLAPLLRQQPDVNAFLVSTLRLSDGAYAQTRLGAHFKRLGAARIGPYAIAATSLKDGRKLTVVLCTKVRFLDGKGRELPESNIEDGHKIDEKLVSVVIRPSTEEFAESVCPQES